MNDTYIDTRTPKEKQSDFGGALMMVGGAAAFILGRRKLAITRGVAKDILGAGLESDSRYAKYVSSKNTSQKGKTVRGSTIDSAKDMKDGLKDPIGYISRKSNFTMQQMRQTAVDRAEGVSEWVKDPIGSLKKNTELFRPLPSDRESYNIAISYFNKHLKHPASMFPAWDSLNIKESSLADKILKGPRVVPFAPGTTLGMAGRKGAPKTVGKYGAVLIDGNLHFLLDPRKAKRLGTFYDENAIIKNVSVGITNSWGANLERQRRGLIKTVNPRNTSEYVSKVILGTRPIIAAERKEFIKRQYLGRFFPDVGISGTQSESDIRGIIGAEYDKRAAESLRGEAPRFYNARTGKQEAIPTLEQFMKSKVSDYDLTNRKSLTFGRKMLEDAAKTRRIIADAAAKRKYEQAGFASFKLGRKTGISEEFASYGSGFPQKVERWYKKGSGFAYKHPVSGEDINVGPRRYNVAGKTLGSNWRGTEGPWYITTPEDSIKRAANVLSSGTLHKVWESASGLGVSSRRNFVTENIRKIAGAQEGSWADMFIRNMGKTGRVMAIGLGAYYSYQAINAIARHTTGWGPSDVAADAYVHYREFQQNVLQHLGIIHAAKSMEDMFPGSVSSPLSHVLRLASPAILATVFGKRFGPKGFQAGLAAGIAFAMITWGDLTQTPDQLHRIYTGEDDIPVRKGRYWIMGNTPFFGGKVSYWRPHWYPLMKSQYQYQGQLWDSPDEQLAQGTAFSPILAPIIMGSKWDPYYWEKKHYYDRPYLVTGELFEPTMPFAALGNATLGRIIKPPMLMHQDYIGTPQVDSSDREYGLPPGVAQELGFPSIPSPAITGGDSPYSLKYQLGEAAYSQSEQMGLLGYLGNIFHKKLTGDQDFIGSESVLQTPRRATGFERAYWQKDIGDPGAGLEEGLTEYFRRFLPHRRSNVDEYNPVPNQMPDWLPGSDYFINFHQGDPYIKIPYGEARLPGAGYEKLHRLHSGESGVYDPVDRFLVLANVAPYSQEYKEYKRQARKMTSGDDYWAQRVDKAISQRDKLNEEYQFLNVDEGNAVSRGYRHLLAGAEDIPNPASINPMNIANGFVPAHLNKWISNKTPEDTYRDFRLYGSEYQPWDQPVQSFITPIVDRTRGDFNPNYVPAAVQKQREVEEYFDKLKYIKYTNLADLARFQGDSALATKLSHIAKTSMAAGNYNPATAMMSIPKEEKGFYNAFSQAEGKRREDILGIVPEYMKPYYMEAWNKVDGKNTYNIDRNQSEQLTAYFQNHYLPGPEWEGWNPDVSLNQVKLRVVKNDAFDIHKFNLWENDERELSRQPFVPLIDNINAPSNNLTMLQNVIMDNMNRMGMRDSRVYITRTPASEDSHKINITLNKDNSDDHDQAMNQVLSVS